MAAAPVNHCLKLCFRGLQIEDRLNEPGVIGVPRVLHFAPINCVCRSVKVQGSLPGYEERVQKVLFTHKFFLDSLYFISLDDLSSWPESTDTLFGDWWHFTCWNLPHLMIKGSIFVCQGKEQVHIEGPGGAKVSQVCVSDFQHTSVGKSSNLVHRNCAVLNKKQQVEWLI